MLLGLHLISIVGIFLVVARLLDLSLSPVLRWLPSGPTKSLEIFIIGIAWLVALAVRGVIGLYVFIFGYDVDLAVLLTGVLGLAGCFCLRSFSNLMSRIWRVGEKDTKSLILPIGLVAVILICYGIMIFVPADHWDSTVKYVTLSKYFANGWNAGALQDALLLGKDSLIYIGSGLETADKMLEISDAQSIVGIGDSQLVLILRWVNLVMVSLAVFGFMGLVGARTKWIAVTTAAILLSPDLIRLGVSSKLDGSIAAIELGAATLVMLAWYCHSKGARGQQNLLLIILGFSLSLFAAASRLSGMYIVCLSGLSFLYLVLSAEIRVPRKLMFLVISVFLFVMFSGLYIVMYPDGIYPGGKSMSQMRELYSIKGLSSGLKEIYLVFHLALGFENLSRKFSIFEFLPHAKHHGVSMFMLSPAMLTIFLAPIFWKRHKIIPIASLLFCFWIIIWASSASYSRVFIAGSSVAVLVGGFIASFEIGGLPRWHSIVVRSVRIGLIGCVITFVPWQIYTTAFRNYDYVMPASLYDNATRHRLKVEFLAKHSGIVKNGDSNFLPTFEDTEAIEGILGHYNLPIVQPDRSRAINILFKDGLFLAPVVNAADMHPDVACLLGTPNFELLKDEEILNRYTSKTIISQNWLLYCR
jgi:hypothetical protein